MSLTRRIFDLARANLTDFRAAFGRDELRELLTDEERDEIERQARDDGSVGARAGRKARQVRDAAEDAWERAYENARNKTGVTRGQSTEVERRRWYRTLEVEYGANLADVRRAYRRLLRVYHPDRHASDPDKYRAATEVTRQITEAYDGLTRHLQG